MAAELREVFTLNPELPEEPFPLSESMFTEVI